MAEKNLASLPEELKAMTFSILKSLPSGGARFGRWTVRNRVLETPTFVGNTSRGTIPHLAQDSYQRHTNIHGVYVPLEDCAFLPLRQSPRSSEG